MKEVKDPDILKQINIMDAYQREKEPHEDINRNEPTNAFQTFARSAIGAIPSAMENVVRKFGYSPEEAIGHLRQAPSIDMSKFIGSAGAQQLRNAEVPQLLGTQEQYERGKVAHPIADILGGMAGFAPLGGATSLAARSIPSVGRLYQAAAPSLLKRSALYGLEGAGQGALYSEPGQEESGAALGSAIGSVLGGPGISLARGFRDRANIPALESSVESSRQRMESDKMMIDQIKKELASRYPGMQTPEAMTRGISQREAQIGELLPAANRSYEPTQNLLPYPTGEENLQNAISAKKENIENIGGLLGQGKKINTQFAERLNDRIKGAKQFIQSEGYNPVQNYAKENNIVVPRETDTKYVEQQLSKLTKDPEFENTPGFQKMKEAFLKTKGSDIIKGNDFIDLWKETKKASAKANAKGYQEGGENQAYWRKQGEDLSVLANKQLSILKEQLPADLFNRLMWADQQWRTRIGPLYGNKIYKQAKYEGRINAPNIMEELRGTGFGQQQMKRLVLSDPELTRLAIGHSYAENPEKILAASPYEQDFINNLPYLKNKINQLKNQNFNIEYAKSQKAQYAKQQDIADKLHERILKEQTERSNAQKKIELYDREISYIRKQLDNLNNSYRRGDISQKEFETKKEKFEEELREKKAFSKKLRKAAAIVTGISIWEHLQ